MTYDFERQQEAWSNPPVDDVGYLPSAELLKLSDSNLSALVEQFEQTRYFGHRNHKGRWRRFLGLDTTTGKRVLDFGCGVGIEALQFARTGNEVFLADISADNLALAERVLALDGYAARSLLIDAVYPFFDTCEVDVFYANGVLHHIPYSELILKRAVEVLAPGGEIRLMLYSDKGWVEATGTPVPPIEEKVTENPEFWTFVRYFDGVGTYADWYSREKLEHRFGDLLDVVSYDYITPSEMYCVAVLEPRKEG